MFISWKLINGLNKMEKRISLWVKFKKLNYFSAAKENVDSPVILNQCGILLEKKSFDMIMMLLFSDQRC